MDNSKKFPYLCQSFHTKKLHHMDTTKKKNKMVEVIELLSSFDEVERTIFLKDLCKEIDNEEFWKPLKKIKIFFTLEGENWYIYSFGNSTYLHNLLKKAGRVSEVKKRSLYVKPLDGENGLSFKQFMIDILPQDRKFIFI